MWPCGRFLTLTYSDENLPSDGGLRRRDWTLFAKRLRKYVPGVAPASWRADLHPLRILACGEYGTRTQRPHYHAIVSNLRLPDEVPGPGASRLSETLSSLWGLGHVRVDEVTPASISYVAGYVRKKMGQAPRGRRYYEKIDESTGELHRLEPEFVQTPLKPGLGLPWLWKYGRDLRKQFITVRGQRRPIPRYFVQKLAEDASFAEAREEYVIGLTERAKLDGRPAPAIRAAQEIIAKSRDRSRRDSI